MNKYVNNFTIKLLNNYIRPSSMKVNLQLTLIKGSNVTCTYSISSLGYIRYL